MLVAGSWYQLLLFGRNARGGRVIGKRHGDGWWKGQWRKPRKRRQRRNQLRRSLGGGVERRTC
jgi:hypothetical protein